MTDLKTQHLLTLAHILSKGGKHNFVNITTTSLGKEIGCLLYTSPSPRDRTRSRMPSSA